MRKLLILIAMLLVTTAAAAAGPWVFLHSDGQITLLDTPCDQPALMAEIRPEFHPRMRVSIEVFQNHRSRGCWLEYDGQILMTWDTGNKTNIPAGAFKESPGT